MGNVNLPTPVALAGGAICIVGGYLLGVLAGPDTPSRTTATVESFDRGTGRLCLSGDGVDQQDGVVEDGTLCGTWRQGTDDTAPRKGDSFRFVSISGRGGSPVRPPGTMIYGDVVP
jgi:hypothetical protein